MVRAGNCPPPAGEDANTMLKCMGIRTCMHAQYRDRCLQICGSGSISNCSVHSSSRQIDHHGEENQCQLGASSRRLNNGKHVPQTIPHELWSTAMKLSCKYGAHVANYSWSFDTVIHGGLHCYRCLWRRGGPPVCETGWLLAETLR